MVQNRHADQWNKTKDPYISKCNFSQLIVNKHDIKHITWKTKENNLNK